MQVQAQLKSVTQTLPLAPSRGFVELARPLPPDAEGFDPSPPWTGKRVFDVTLALGLLPVLGIAAVFVGIMNRVWNPGPLVFSQLRMGQGYRPFVLYKFRSMRLGAERGRGPDDPVETDRIGWLGHLLRRTRIDELPQIVNVLKGDMSFVGPRPDMYGHALRFIRTVPRYRQRHRIRPGITGYAQVTAGYAEGTEGARLKARRDAIYVRRASWRLDISIIARTVFVILTGRGAR